MIYDNNEFKDNFLGYEFDIKLIEEDNELLNSNEHYIDYKKEYFSKSIKNHERLSVLLGKFNNLNNFEGNNNRKYTYNFVNNNIKEEYNKEIKQIYIDQRNLFTNFINHIDFLNCCKNTKYNDLENILVDKSRMTRLVDK